MLLHVVVNLLIRNRFVIRNKKDSVQLNVFPVTVVTHTHGHAASDSISSQAYHRYMLRRADTIAIFFLKILHLETKMLWQL